MLKFIRRLLGFDEGPLANRSAEELVDWIGEACQACWIEWRNETYLLTYEVAWYPDEGLCDDHKARAHDGRIEHRAEDDRRLRKERV